MAKFSAFLQRKNIIFSAKRYGIDALGAMAQGLFCTLLVGTILNTLGQMGIGFLNEIVVTIKQNENTLSYTIGGLASAMVGPGIAVAIGMALGAPGMVLFSLIPVGFAANAMGPLCHLGQADPGDPASGRSAGPGPSAGRTGPAAAAGRQVVCWSRRSRLTPGTSTLLHFSLF